MKKLLIPILLILAIGLFFNSCQNDNDSDILENNYSFLRENSSKIILGNGQNNRNTETYINYLLDDSRTHSLPLENTKESVFFKSYETTWVTNTFINQFLNILSIEDGITPIYSFTMYGNFTIKKSSGISTKNVKGIGVYKIVNNTQLVYELYKNSKNGFVKDLSSINNAKTINSRDALYIYDSFFKMDSSNNSFVTFRNETINRNYDSSNSEDMFILKEAEYYANQIKDYKLNGTVTDYLFGRKRNCGPGCVDGGGPCEGGNDPHMPGGDCSTGGGNDNEICANDEAERQLSGVNNINLLKNKDSNNLYYFRDNFLKESIIGDKYVKYYYAFSQHIDIDLSLSMKAFTLMPKVSTLINKIRSNDTNPNEILIDEEFKNEVLSLINDSKTLSSKQITKSLIEDLKSDLSNLSGKTKSEFINEFIIN